MTGITPMSRKAERIKRLFGGKVAVGQPEEIDPDKFFPVPNRREKRLQGQRGKQTGTGTVADLLRLGPRPKAKGGTGQPHWFKVMKYEAARRASLEKVTMDRLQPAVGQIALDLYAAGYKTVWDVTQVEDASQLLSETVSTAQLDKLRNYLTQQRVPVKWYV